MSEEELLSVWQAARIAGWNRETARRKVKRAGLIPVKYDRRPRLYRRSEILAALGPCPIRPKRVIVVEHPPKPRAKPRWRCSECKFISYAVKKTSTECCAAPANIPDWSHLYFDGAIRLFDELIEPGEIIMHTRQSGGVRQSVVYEVKETGMIEVVPEAGSFKRSLIPPGCVVAVFHEHRQETGCCEFDEKWHRR